MEVRLSSSAEKPRVRLVAKKTEVEIPSAQQPPVPEIKRRKEEWEIALPIDAPLHPPLKAKAKKSAVSAAAPKKAVTAPAAPKVEPVENKPKKVKPLTAKQQKKLAFQQRYELAKEMSAKNPGLSPDAANFILLGNYTLEEWLANQELKRKKNLEKWKAHQERAKAVQAAKWSLAMETLEYQLLERFRAEQSTLWFETTWGDLTGVQLRRVTLYRLMMKNSLGQNLPWKKLKLASFGVASEQPNFDSMREIVEPEKRSFVLEEKPADRWPFPHELFNDAVGRRVRATLVNGSVWSGYLSWACRYSFGLSTEPSTDEASIVIFKHACCGIDLE